MCFVWLRVPLAEITKHQQHGPLTQGVTQGWV